MVVYSTGFYYFSGVGLEKILTNNGISELVSAITKAVFLAIGYLAVDFLTSRGKR